MNTTTATAPATWDNTFEAIIAGNATRVRRILTARGAHFEVLSTDGRRWSRIDTMKAADGIAAFERK